MSQQVSGVLSNLERVLLDADEIQARVAALGQTVGADFAGNELTVVVLLDGALFFVADLVRQIDLPVRLYSLTVSSYHGGMVSTGQVEMAPKFPFDLKGRHVLLVDDILDTGLTLSSVIDKLQEAGPPASLKTAVLLRKDRQREREVAADYVGFDIADEFVVGYGMDYQGHYRNLPCIGILNPS